MSLSFTVTHQKESRRVTCERSSTVGALLGVAIQKFKLSPATNATLFYGGKALDPSSPIRFSNLLNNGKLTLEVSTIQIDVNLKVIAKILGAPSTQILKMKASTPLPLLVEEFCSKSGVSWPSTATVSISALYNVVDSSMPTFSEATVGSMVGHVPSAVVRLNVEESRGKNGDPGGMVPSKAAGTAETEGTAETAEKVADTMAQTAETTETAGKLADTMAQTAETTETAGKLADTMAETTAKEPVENSARASPVIPETSMHIKGRSEENAGERNAESISEKLSNDESKKGENWSTSNGKSSDVEKSTVGSAHHNEKQTAFAGAQNVPIASGTENASQDVAYVPSSGTQTYENPDEDYELTSTQAEKYYKILKSMQSRPKAKRSAFIPSQYTIRLRFPDRTLLDVHFDDPEVRLGQVLKKIDSYIDAQYVNSYKLKSSSPPFKEITTSFASNNTPLKEIPEFQSEKLLLIWEPLVSAGNYLKQGIARKGLAEMPMVKLESTRGKLADDSPAPKKVTTKGMPKWFKTGK